ncbi:MAG: two-component system, response regulator YesN [Clostridiales bacterium]|nr:two-component system, response regulator YesN [Clostridiales bacterium]
MRAFLHNQRQKFIQVMQFNSIFFKAIFILFVLIFIIILGFYYYVNSSYQAAYKDKRVDENITVLASINREVDLNISALDVQVQDILKGDETLSMAISGNDDAFYPIDIALTLYTFAARNPWVDTATLYIKNCGIAMDSDKNIIEDVSDDLFKEHRYFGDGYLRWYEGELYYMAGFPTEKHLAVMAIRLDRERMYNYLVDEVNMDPTHSFLYFEDIPVFDSFCNYPKALLSSIDFSEKLSSQATIAKANEQGKLKLRYISQKTGFDWLIDMEESYLYPGLSDVLIQMSPFLIGILLLSMGAFYYMLNYVYKPIKQVMESVKGYQQNKADHEAMNELDTIQRFFEDNLQKQALLERALSSVEQEVSDRFIMNLAQNEHVDADYVNQFLDEINTPYRDDGRYQAMVLKRLKPGGDHYLTMYMQISFLHQLRAFWHDKAYSCICETSTGDIVLIHQYPPKHSSVTVKSDLTQFENYLHGIEAGEYYCLGIGRIYDALLQVRQSYTDAETNAMMRMAKRNGSMTIKKIPTVREPETVETGKDILHIAHAKSYIEEHFADSNLSLSEVSEACAINSSYLSRLFVEYLSQGFLEYLNKHRIAYSETLLIGSELTVSEIASKSGFNSSQSYIRVFKKYNHETPGLFRARKVGAHEKS